MGVFKRSAHLSVISWMSGPSLRWSCLLVHRFIDGLSPATEPHHEATTAKRWAIAGAGNVRPTVISAIDIVGFISHSSYGRRNNQRPTPCWLRHFQPSVMSPAWP